VRFDADIHEAEKALDILGCMVLSINVIGEGAIVVIEKQKATPEKYPRRFAKIKSSPL
jgi:hypothetical protein